MKLKKLYSPLTLGIFVILLKLLIIDIDPPKWNIGYYQPIDELYYTSPAVNLYKYGTISHNEDMPAWGIPFATNLMTYTGLTVFGNNYTGLRFSSIVFALVSLIFFYLILKRITQNKSLHYLGVFLLVLSYPFTLSNIVVEPTIARMAALSLSMFITIKWYERTETKKHELIVFMGIIVLLWLFSYPTNVFTLLAFFVIAVLKEKKYIQNKQFFKIFSKVILPVFIGFIIGGIIYILVNLPVFEQIGLFSRSGNYSDRIALDIRTLFFNGLNLRIANIFLFNPIIMFVLVISIFTITSKILKKNKLNNEIIIIIIFLLCFALQSLFINDFPQRKLIILLPVVLLIILQGLEYFFEPPKNILPVLTGVFFIMVYALSLIKFGGNLYKVSWIVTGLFIGAFIIIKYIGKINRYKYFILVIPILLSVFNTINYSLTPVTKHYKEAAISLIDKKKVNYIGGMSKGFSLYNDNNMLLNCYLYYGKFDEFWHENDSIAASNDFIDYAIAYEDESSKFNEIGFEKYKTLLAKDSTVYTRNILIFREKKN